MYVDDPIRDVHVITKDNARISVTGMFLEVSPPASPTLCNRDIKKMSDMLRGNILVDLEYLNSLLEE